MKIDAKLKRLDHKIKTIMQMLGYFQNDGGLESELSGSLSMRQKKDDFNDKWILYQYDKESRECSLRYVLPELADTIDLYKGKNLHLETVDKERMSGDLGLVVHKGTTYFESNINRWSSWGAKAEKQMQKCRDQAIA